MNRLIPLVKNNSHESYCLNKAAPEGSNLYYACLFAAAEYKPAIIAIHALLNELNDVILECSAPDLARIRYLWWQEELQRIKTKEAKHPVSVFIQKNLRPDDAACQLLQIAVNTFANFLCTDQPETFQGSLKLFQPGVGKLWRYCAVLLEIEDEETLTNIEVMAAAYYFLQALQQPNAFLTESCCIISADYIQMPQLLNATDSDKQIQEMFASILKQIITQLETGYRQFDNDDKRRFKHGLILNRMAIKIAQKMLKNSGRLLTTRINLAPISKFLLAWWTSLSLGKT